MYQIHLAESRGKANFGWLKSFHSFSFANYYNPERMNFGVLRVLNDDSVEAGMGFTTHSHENMEIISIPLEGDLLHKDSMNNSMAICQGDVQVMSAGKGISHSEYNNSKTSLVKFLQIWIFPNKRNVEPRYQQMSFKNQDRLNQFQLIVSPKQSEQTLWIYQNAYLYLASFEQSIEKKYELNEKKNGLYIFNLAGQLSVDGHTINTRDALAITAVNSVTIKAISKSEFLLIEVPEKG
jgi:redox-sensitive bicupin YhaK (pirin superfamily)